MMIQFKKESLPKVNFQLLGGVVFLVESFLFGAGVSSVLHVVRGVGFAFGFGFHWFRKSMKGLIVLHTYVYTYISSVYIYSSIKKRGHWQQSIHG